MADLNRQKMKFHSPLLLGLFLVGCSSIPQEGQTKFRPDVLYYRNDSKGQKAAQEVARLYEGRQKVILVDQKLSGIIPVVPISQPPPHYPYEMWQSELEGSVTVDFIVNEAGRVFDAVVVETTNPGFNGEAVKAVRQWTFKSATRNGMNIRMRLRATLDLTSTNKEGRNLRVLLRPSAQRDSVESLDKLGIADSSTSSGLQALMDGKIGGPLCGLCWWQE